MVQSDLYVYSEIDIHDNQFKIKQLNLKSYKLISMDLQRFADGGSGEKTEAATPKKREKAREEGQVAKSTEITTAMILVGMFSLLRLLGGWMAEHLLSTFYEAFSMFNYETIDIRLMFQIYVHFLLESMYVLVPIFGMAFAIAFISNLVQVGWKPTLKPLTPKLNRLSPVQGFKRMFSMRTILELVKSILKLAIIMLIVYLTLKDYDELIFNLYDVGTFQAYVSIMNIVLDVCIRIGMYFIFIAAIDFGYQKYKHEKDLRMTKQEIKEERKMMDGNPEVKSRIRQRMREAAMRRMMQDLPKADVIITNPTHFAVAIQYDEHSARAPVVVAKGADLVAARIRETAKEYDIEIVENKPLARTLYYTVEIGDEIPPELYQAVAEVLAFVYSLKNRSALT